MSKMLAMRLNVKLQLLCSQRGWGQSDLLDRVGGIGKSTLSNWFNGRNKPDLESSLRIARAFGVPLEYLADDELDEPPPPPSPPLSVDEEAILALIADLGLSRREAIQRLARPLESGPAHVSPTKVIVGKPEPPPMGGSTPAYHTTIQDISHLTDPDITERREREAARRKRKEEPREPRSGGKRGGTPKGGSEGL